MHLATIYRFPDIKGSKSGVVKILGDLKYLLESMCFLNEDLSPYHMPGININYHYNIIKNNN